MAMTLNENLFEEIKEEAPYVEEASKSVPDSDGFMTDYTWYTNGKKHIFMFGDSDLYEPDEDYADHEVEIYPGNEENAYKEAKEWFDNYKGFAEGLDEGYHKDSFGQSNWYENVDDVMHDYEKGWLTKVRAMEICDEEGWEFYDDLDESLTESWTTLVKDSINHLVNDLGMDPDTEDFADDVINDIENNYKDEINVDLSNIDIYNRWASEIACEVSRQLNECKSINEDFSSTLPKWLINFLLKNKKYKDTISNRTHLDLANMKYVRIPKDEIPTNGFHPIMKDNSKQLVYLLRDLNGNIVYFPGVNDDYPLSIDPSNNYKSTPIKNLSKKQLLDHTIQMGYIEMDDSSNFNRDKQNERRLSREGVLERGRGQYEYEDKEYPLNPETLRRDYEADPIITKTWTLTRGQDKSGYPIDKDKYKKMLDQADMQTYSKQYERYTKKLETLRSAIIDYMMGMSLTKSKRGWGSSLQSAIGKFEDAIKDFGDLQESIERTLNSKKLNDEEKNKIIQMEFDGNESFNYISSLRKNIENAWKYLNELKDKQLEEELSPSSVVVGEESEDPMVALARKHDLDILSPMGTEPGSMRVSGTVRDLDNFYKEAEELGLLKLEEKLTSQTFSEFQKIADEIGLISAGDLERFKEEEMLPGESELDAIKRYRQELIDAGVDLNKLKKESLNEALHGKDEFNEFMSLANKLGFTTAYQLNYIMNAAKALGESELDMLKSIDKIFNGNVPDNIIDGITDEFIIIADQLGFKDNEDYKRFCEEEVESGETITQAIRRYRQELIDAGVDINKLKESLNESAMSELDLEVKELKKEIPELKGKIKDLNYDVKMAGRGGNSDASETADIKREIEELTQSIKEKEDRLAYIKKTYK